MYQIYYNDELVYDPRSANAAEPGDVSFSVLDAQLKLAVGSGGQLTFTLPAGHPLIGTIELKSGVVKVVEVLPGGSSTVFLGRVISDETSFDNSHSYQCEGQMAFFNDTYTEPGTYPPAVGWTYQDYQTYNAAVSAGTVPALRLADLIAKHNAMVGQNGQITLGNVTVTGAEIPYKASEWLTTWERMNAELIDTFGGFFHIRYSGTTAILDYLASTADFTDWNGQSITFGENLADITRKTTGDAGFNAILPLVNGKTAVLGIPFYEDGTYGDGAYQKTGTVLKKVGEPSNIIAVMPSPIPVAGQQPATYIENLCTWLGENSGIMVNSLTVRAYDLSTTDPDTEPFRVGRMVRIMDPPNDIREAYLVMGVTIDLTGGADVDLDLGAKATSLTSSGAQRIIEEDTSKRVPQVLYRNTSPSSSQSSGALSSIGDISAYNLFFIEVCWSTGYTSHRGGTWVYVPDGTSVIAHPSVDWTDSGTAHAYRQVTINKSNSAGSQISLGTGNSSTPSGTSSGTSYAIVTTIIGYTV